MAQTHVRGEDNKQSSKRKVAKEGKEIQVKTKKGKVESEKEYSCPTCQGDASEGVVECCRCERWYHFACAGLEDRVDLLENVDWDCVECEADTALFRTADEEFMADSLLHATNPRRRDVPPNGDGRQGARTETISTAPGMNHDAKGVTHDVNDHTDTNQHSGVAEQNTDDKGNGGHTCL